MRAVQAKGNSFGATPGGTRHRHVAAGGEEVYFFAVPPESGQGSRAMISGVSSSSAVYGLPQLRAGQGKRGQGAGTTATGQAPTDQQQQQIQELQRADSSVRQHEAAHQAAGGPYAGGASFTYTRGPDGKNYATAGEVPVDTSPERDPQATIRKMDTVKAAALAPADPSPQDLRVAQQADAAKAQAQQETRKKQSGTSGQPGQAGQGDGASPGDGQPQTGAGRNGAGNGTAAPALAARGAAAYGAAYGLGRQPARASITV